MTGKDIPRIVFTTDANGTTMPGNMFAELVRADGKREEMAHLMKPCTAGECGFSITFI